MNPAVLIPVLAPLLEAALKQRTTAATPVERVAESVAIEVASKLPGVAKSDPVLKNELNQEPLVQSRVVIGNVVAALGVLIPIGLHLFGVDVSSERVVEIGGAIVVLAGAGYSLYGRIKGGLKPLFSRS